MSPSGADAGQGKEVFEKRCTGCHGLESEKDGPRLRGVYGRKAGAIPSFQYSEALKKSGITWDNDSLDKWLADPGALVPDSDMAFRVVSKEERAAVIEYLKQVSAQ